MWATQTRSRGKRAISRANRSNPVKGSRYGMVPTWRTNTWLDHYEQGGADALVPRGRPRKAVAWARRRALVQQPSPQARAYGHAGESARDSRLVELERKVGQQAVELDFFKEALRHVKAPPRPRGGRGAKASSRSSTR